jgi:hypothetical protein
VAGVKGGEIGTLQQPEAGKASKSKGVCTMWKWVMWSQWQNGASATLHAKEAKRSGRRDSRLIAP